MSHRPRATPGRVLDDLRRTARGSGRVGYWEVLRRRPGNRFLLGSAVSGFGDSLVPLALAFAILHLTGSVALLGVALGLSRAPALVVTLLGGVAGDRLPPRRLVLVANLAKCVLHLASGVALLLLAAGPAAAVMITTQLFAASFGQFGGPASARVLRLLIVDARDINAATGLTNTARHMTHIGAQGASGLLVYLGSPAARFLVTAASHLLFVLLLPRVEDRGGRHGPPRRRASVRADFVEGLRALRERRQFAWALASTVVCWLLVIQPFLVLTPAVLNAVDRRSASVMWGTIGVGIGAGWHRRWPRRGQVPAARPAHGATALALADLPLLAVLAAVPGHWLMYPLAAVTGIQSVVARIWLSQELYAVFPVDRVARAQSLVTAAWLLPAMASSLATPLLAEAVGVRPALAALAAVFLPAWCYVVLRVARLGRGRADLLP